MELVTASDLLVTASVALLLSFLVAKLVSLAMTDTHNTTKKHHIIINDEVVGPVLRTEQQPLTVQSSESDSGFINPVQVTTTVNVETVETEQERRDFTVESDSEVVVELPMPVEKSEVVFDEFLEQRKEELVEEIMEENLTEKVVEREVNERDEKKNDDDDGDWEWEGIERSEIEKVFMEATKFVGEKGFDDDDDEVEMELYGLHKVAMEGPCRETQPMPLKLFARAKWNAWQKLGNMSPDVAMERYISILSDKVPGWMKHTSSAGITEPELEPEPAGSEVSESAGLDLSSSLSHQQLTATERELQQESGDGDNSPLTESDLENNVKK